MIPDATDLLHEAVNKFEKLDHARHSVIDELRRWHGAAPEDMEHAMDRAIRWLEQA
jgi:hypothetical protein